MKFENFSLITVILCFIIGFLCSSLFFNTLSASSGESLELPTTTPNTCKLCNNVALDSCVFNDEDDQCNETVDNLKRKVDELRHNELVKVEDTTQAWAFLLDFDDAGLFHTTLCLYFNYQNVYFIRSTLFFVCFGTYSSHSKLVSRQKTNRGFDKRKNEISSKVKIILKTKTNKQTKKQTKNKTKLIQTNTIINSYNTI